MFSCAMYCVCFDFTLLWLLRCSFWLCVLITISQVMHLDAEKEMMSQCVALLGKFIAVREPNIRYLGLVCCQNTNALFVICCTFLSH